MISTQPGGYRLVPAEVDSEQFEKLLAAAMRERDKGYLDGAAVRLERALSLWEGNAFSDADAGDCVAAEADRLAELRLVALEEQTDVMLAMGAHAQVVSRLKPLIERYPLRETLYRHLMSALHQSGRPAEALAIYADLRAKLAEELGTEPTPDVQRLYRALLSPQTKHHGSTAVWPPFAVSARRRAPSQLPGDIADFVPCETTDVLAPALTASDRTTTAVTAITGQGGAGKTAAAVHLAHRLRPWFPDGQLYVDLGGSTRHPTDPAAALAQMLLALDHPMSALPEGIGAQAACFRDSLRGRRVLTVLDDAADEAQVRHLLPGNVESAVIITSRARLTSLPFTSRVEHEDMSLHQALMLFRRVLGAARVDRDLVAAREVARLCGCLPLALRIAAARLAARPHWSFADLAHRLTHRSRLDELTHGPLSVRSCFAPAYHRLAEDDRRLFRMLGLSGVRVLSAPPGTALPSLAVPDVAEALERLADTRLLKVVHTGAPGTVPRFWLHGLVSAYARERAEAEASDIERAAAQELRRLEDRETAVPVLPTAIGRVRAGRHGSWGPVGREPL
ncbi:AfsR/SARP family transcriptional regulator [Streptomyces sp. PRKS01-29]|nr:AfsR/SARP family transcriptional regulator [Streptomyces sabulosicollis]MBI0297910.1 AfsR/SARP family transcriptional regulator [Streptomyces sabulosicollis]